jgi:Na+-transporting methylmalonyl-CoA/oxaloacetate decarboxylase gamma subunit
MNPNNGNNPKKQEAVRIPDFSKKALEVKPVVVKKVKKQKAGIDYMIQGMIFLILSILVLAAVYFVYNNAQSFIQTGEVAKEQKLVFENDLVRADRSRVVSIEAGATKESVRSLIVQALLNEHVNKGDISLVMPSYLRDTYVGDERKLVSELQRGDDFFFTFAVRAPLNLRTISAEKYAIGTAGVGDVKLDGSKNFFAFSVSSAPDATRELLRYESQMYNDMRQLLKLRDVKGTFYYKDLSYNNHTLRVGYDDTGVVMVYGFGAPKTIIMAPDAETFEMVYEHLK